MSFCILGLLVGGVIGYFVNDTFRLLVSDAYNSVFKVLITDRVLREEAVAYSNLPYCNTSHQRQTLDLYVPRSSTKRPMPLMVFIHGGGWRAGDKSSQILSYYGEPLLKHGIAVASINYRLFPEVTYPGPNDDVACALTYLRNNATTYNLSTTSWGIFGDSAGAQLGAMAMSDPAVNAPLKLFVGFYGPYDMMLQAHRTPVRDVDAWNYTNHGRDAAVASPILRSPKRDATYLLFHGDRDRIVHNSQSRQFAAYLKQQGIDVALTSVSHAGHGFGAQSMPTSHELRLLLLEHVTNL